MHLSYLSRQDKLKLAFDHLDLDGSGELDTEELQARKRSRTAYRRTAPATASDSAVGLCKGWVLEFARVLMVAVLLLRRAGVCQVAQPEG